MKFASTLKAYNWPSICFSDQTYTSTVSSSIPFHSLKVSFLARERRLVEKTNWAGHFEHFGRTTTVTRATSVPLKQSYQRRCRTGRTQWDVPVETLRGYLVLLQSNWFILFYFFYEGRYARVHLQIQIFYGRTIYFRGGGWKNKKSLIWKAFVQETLQKLCRKKKVKNGS